MASSPLTSTHAAVLEAFELPDVLGRWREAHRIACDAERILFDAQMLHIWGLATPPPAAQRRTTSELRLVERALFGAASALFTPTTFRVAKVLS